MSEENGVSTLDRREAVKVIALLPFAASWELTPPQLERALSVLEQQQAQQPQYRPKFFTRSEWATVRMLADYIIPRDDRSGSATDARVPEYIDFLLADKDATEASKVAMRGGLGWIDFECQRRFSTNFVRSTEEQRRAVLDDIAWPRRARPALSHGVAFFSRFRDLVAGGFFSSAMGWRDVRFVGNVFNPNWTGCPATAMAKLGVSQDLMNTRVPVQTRS